MSKYISGNQKHLTLEDRVYIENELAKGTSFKNIAAFLCKDPTTISKEVRAHRLSDWYHKGTFYNARNFCTHRYHCKKTMSVERYFFVVLNVLPVQHAIRSVGISRKNAVKGLIKLHMYVTDVLRR